MGYANFEKIDCFECSKEVTWILKNLEERKTTPTPTIVPLSLNMTQIHQNNTDVDLLIAGVERQSIENGKLCDLCDIDISTQIANIFKCGKHYYCNGCKPSVENDFMRKCFKCQLSKK
jgi:hypothetical protein